MSNEVANKPNNAMAALQGLKKGIQNTRQALPTSSTVPILRMGTDGIWVYGQENTEVEDDSLWAVNPLSIQHGYVCWTNKEKGEGKNELLGEVYAPMAADPVDFANLKDHGWPWKPAACVTLKCTSGEDEGVEVVFKPSSAGGMNVMQKLLTEIEKQLDTGTDAIVPVVELSNDNYIHKQYGKTYVPILDVDSWLTMDGPAAEEAVQQEEKPARAKPARTKPAKATRKEAPASEPEVEDEPDDQEDEEPAVEEKPKTEGRVRRRRRAS